MLQLNLFDRNERIIRHFDNNGANLARQEREKVIDRDEPNEVAIFVYGECTSLHTVKMALEKKYSAILLLGPKISGKKDKETKLTCKQELIQLKESYPEKLHVFSQSNRPTDHATLIKNTLFFENQHDIDEHYDFAYIIENARNKEIKFFKDSVIRDINNAKKMTLEDIRNMPEYGKTNAENI